MNTVTAAVTTTHCQACDCPGQKSSAAIDLRLQLLQFVAQFLHGLAFLAHFLLSAGAVFGTEAQQRLQEQAAAAGDHHHHRQQAPEAGGAEAEQQALQHPHPQRAGRRPHQKPADAAQRVAEQQGHADPERDHQQAGAPTHPERPDPSHEAGAAAQANPRAAAAPAETGQSRAHHHLIGEQEHSGGEEAAADQEQQEVLRGLGGHGAAPGSGIPSIASVGCDGNKKAPPVAGLEG